MYSIGFLSNPKRPQMIGSWMSNGRQPMAGLIFSIFIELLQLHIHHLGIIGVLRLNFLDLGLHLLHLRGASDWAAYKGK